MHTRTIEVVSLFLAASVLGCSADKAVDDPVFTEAPKDIYAAASDHSALGNGRSCKCSHGHSQNKEYCYFFDVLTP